MRINQVGRTIVFVFAFALLLVNVSCTKDLAGPASTTTDDNANVTTASPAAATTPTSRTPVPAPVALPVANTTGAQVAPAPDVEFPAAAMTPIVLQAVSATQAKLDGLTASIDGTRVRFVDCSEAASCTARVEAPSLTTLRDLLQAVSQEQTGGIGFVAREQLDAFTGRTFVADLTLGGTATRAVPSDENALLTN